MSLEKITRHVQVQGRKKWEESISEPTSSQVGEQEKWFIEKM